MENCDENIIEEITIVGGGDAGLFSALLLEKIVPKTTITVVDDFQEDPPNVGKSTISYILKSLHEVLDIDKRRFISEVKPVWKASAYFQNWCNRKPFHVPFDEFTLRPDDGDAKKFGKLLYRYENDEYTTLGSLMTESKKSPFMRQRDGSLNVYHHVAYHLGVNRLNRFLRELCEERGIDLIDDQITEVRVRNNRIDHIESDTAEYRSDLYIDATGFKRLLMKNLENKFNEFDIPLDSAVVAKSDIELREIVPATVIETGNCGWFWQIDTYDWRDMGYVYSSAHISDEDAIEEFIEARGKNITPEELQTYRFESGYYEQAWVSNCIAAGNALGFVEPLESTALTTNAILFEKLSELIRDHGRINHSGAREIYNTYAKSIWENLYDFISIHYRFASGTTEFWKDVTSVGDHDRISQIQRSFQTNGFNSHREFNQWQFYQDNLFYRVFNQWQFYRLMADLGVGSEFYDELEYSIDSTIEDEIKRQRERTERNLDNCLSYEELEDIGVY